MAQHNFARALALVLRAEGGYANDPRDAGGPTYRGITLAVARAAWKADATADDLRRMPPEVIAAIYRRRYWNAVTADAMPGGLDYALFDLAVNSGVVRALALLRAALGLPSRGHAVDAELLGAVARRDVAATIEALCDRRLNFLRGLKRWAVFGAGWQARMRMVRREALAMAAQAGRAAASPAMPTGADGDQAKAVAKSARREHARQGPVVAAASGAGFFSLAGVLALAGERPWLAGSIAIGAVMALAALALIFIRRRRAAS